MKGSKWSISATGKRDEAVRRFMQAAHNDPQLPIVLTPAVIAAASALARTRLPNCHLKLSSNGHMPADGYAFASVTLDLFPLSQS